MMASLSLLVAAVVNIQLSAGLNVLYQDAGPLDPNSEDLLTYINMTDNMFIKMDIEVESFPDNGAWRYLFFIGDPFARVPDIWLWDPSHQSYSSFDGFLVHFSRDGSGQLFNTLQGSSAQLEANTVYTLEICYGQTSLTTRLSGGAISGVNTATFTKKIHDNVKEPVHVGYPSNDHGDADAIITNLYIGSDADCSEPLDIPTVDCDDLDIDGYLSTCSELYGANVDDIANLEAEIAAINDRIDDIITDVGGAWNSQPLSAGQAVVGDVIGNDPMNDGDESVIKVIFDKYRDYFIVFSLMLNAMVIGYISCSSSNNNSCKKYQYHHVKYIDSSDNENAAMNM